MAETFHVALLAGASLDQQPVAVPSEPAATLNDRLTVALHRAYKLPPGVTYQARVWGPLPLELSRILHVTL